MEMLVTIASHVSNIKFNENLNRSNKVSDDFKSRKRIDSSVDNGICNS